MFNNKTKTFLLLTLIFIAICGISTATAANIDNNDTSTIATDTTSDTSDVNMATDTSDEIVPTTDVSTKNINKKTVENVKSEGEGTFQDLQTDIAGSDVTLQRDYIQQSGESAITIDSLKNINGDGKTITVSNASFILTNTANVTFENLIFKGITNNAMFMDNSGTVTFKNVTFKNLNTSLQNLITPKVGANITIDNSTFEEIISGSIVRSTYKDVFLNINNSKFNNVNMSYSAIQVNGVGWTVNINNSNFTNIKPNEGAAVNGAVIQIMSKNNNKMFIDYSRFEDNVATSKAGVLYWSGNNGILNVTNSYFRKNSIATDDSGKSLAGAIDINNANTNVSFFNNTMEENEALSGADIYFESYARMMTPLYITPESASALQYDDVNITVNLTDDKANKIAYNSGGFTYDVIINQETVFTGAKSETKSIIAQYNPADYPIGIGYDETSDKITSVIKAQAVLQVLESTAYKYSTIQQLIDNAQPETTITIDKPVIRASADEKIILNKSITLDLNNLGIDAEKGRIFDVTDGVTVTVKNGYITDVANPEAETSIWMVPTAGRIANVSNGNIIFDNILFEDSKAPCFGSNSPGNFITVSSESTLSLNNCTITNCTGTFIDNRDAKVTINDTVFENNIYTDTNHPALINDGGLLDINNTKFINNRANLAIIYGQSQLFSLSGFTYNGPMTIDNTLFKGNNLTSGMGVINTEADTNITNSVFTNNKQTSANAGGAITSNDGTLVVYNSTFTENTIRDDVDGSIILNKDGDLDVSYSLLIPQSTTTKATVYNKGSGTSLTANYNYWATNSTDKYIQAARDSGITIDNWVILNSAMAPAEDLNYYDTVTITTTLNKYTTDGTTLIDLTQNLPEYSYIKYTADSGNFSEDEVKLTNGVATTTYTVKTAEFTINAEYPNEVNILKGKSSTTPQVYVLNDGNWTHYFNEDDGTINDAVVIPNSELRFEGVFTDRMMTINIPVNITTADEQAVLNNCTFTVVSDNVNITKIEMVSDDREDALITVEDASSVNIEDNKLTLTNNDKMVTHTINVLDSQDVIIKGNTITTTGPEENIVLDSLSIQKLVYTVSINSENSDALIIETNKITTKTNGKESTNLGTIYGLYVKGNLTGEEPCTNVQIVGNEIITDADKYAYGISIQFIENSLVELNNITTTGRHYADGINVLAVSDSTINNNTIDVQANNYTYGIICDGIQAYQWSPFAMYLNPVDSVTISDNTISCNANFTLIELFYTDSVMVKNNEFVANGNYGIGIAVGSTEDSIIEDNNISIAVQMEGNEPSVGSFGYHPTGVLITYASYGLTSGNTVKYNTIKIEAPDTSISAVNVTEDENVIMYNYLESPLGLGNEAVDDTGSDNIIENNVPGNCILTDENYSEFFDEECVLKPLFNNSTLTASGDFVENTVFIFDGVNVTFTSDDTAVFYDGQFMTGNGAKVVFDGLVLDNSVDAFVLESEGNIINNTVIVIDSEDSITGILVVGDNNTIVNTELSITAPSANVVYDMSDYSVITPAPSAITVQSNDNLLENVTIFFNGTEAIHNEDPDAWDSPTVNGLYFVSSEDAIENNVIRDSEIEVIGSYYVYGINVGNARNSLLENVCISVGSDYYADAIQLFDADGVTISGDAVAIADYQAYGVYSTVMGMGYSKNINLTNLNFAVSAEYAVGVLIEGSRDVVIADSEYEIEGENAVAIQLFYANYGGYTPTNITVTGVKIEVETDGDANVISVYKADDVTIDNNRIVTEGGTEINIEKSPNVKVTNNYIKIDGVIYGDYAVISTEDDTVIENNKPKSQKMEELEQTIEDQQKQIEELQEQLAELTKTYNTTLTLDEVTGAKFNGKVTIKGTLMADDTPLNDQIVTLNVNGKTVKVFTTDGEFEYEATIPALGEQTVTATYGGTDKYNTSDASVSFNVEKQGLIIIVDDISDVAFCDNATITGALTDSEGKIVYNTKLYVKVNNKMYTTTTNRQGEFSISVLANAIGENTVSVFYNGNNYYTGTSTNVTFNSVKQQMVITIDPISSTQFNNNVTITGKVTDKNGNILINTRIAVKVNGKSYLVTTDKSGKFSFTAKANAIDTNTVTASYGGNAYYEATSTEATFTAVKQDVTISIDNKISGKTVTGKVTDKNGNILTKTNIWVTVNSKSVKIQTDTKGVFTLNSDAVVAGQNRVVVSFNGNNYYNTATVTEYINV